MTNSVLKSYTSGSGSTKKAQRFYVHCCLKKTSDTEGNKLNKRENKRKETSEKV